MYFYQVSLSYADFIFEQLFNYLYSTTEKPKLRKISSFRSKDATKKLKPEVPAPVDKCKLTLPDGSEIELDILEGTAGPKMIDIRTLYAKSGMFTFDPGFTATGSCVSKITYIDGPKGELLHRGYKIEDLAENCTFIEV